MSLIIFITITVLGLFTFTLLAIYVPKLIVSIQHRGLKATTTLVMIKVKSVLELLMPRTIWGERVGLRTVKSSLTDTEIEQIYRWGCDEEILRFTGGTPSQLTLEEFKDLLHRERWHPQSDQRVFYIVVRTGEVIGRVGLFVIDWTKREGELGILIDKKYWNKHYGRDAIRLLEQYIFAETPIERIYLGTFKENERALRSFEASGFHVVGVTNRYNPVAGKIEDGIEMEITRHDIQ
jgi:RimJ/RimL family protein N-acetyltransferase